MWEQMCLDLLLGDWPDDTVAMYTACKRALRSEQVKADEDFQQLPFRMYLAHEVAVRYQLAHQQLPVACQQDAMFIARNAGQRRIVELIAVQRVEAEHPQIRCETAQMCVQDETYIAQRFGSQVIDRAYIQRFEDGVYADAVPVLNQVIKVNRLSIDKYKIDLGMRYTQ